MVPNMSLAFHHLVKDKLNLVIIECCLTKATGQRQAQNVVALIEGLNM